MFGISRDSPWSHVAWSEVLDLGFPLVSDWNGEAIRALGIATEFRGMQDVGRRSVFLVDGDGIIRKVWHYAPSEVPDLDPLIRAAERLASPPF